MNNMPLIIAHRGASIDAPENTAIAIELAAQQGATWVEVDLHLTADRNIVVIHDPVVAKTTDGNGRVIDMTLAQLHELDAGSWFANEYSEQRLLSLEQLITLLERLQLNVNLEIKAEPGVEVETSEIVAKILQQHWPVNKALPVMSSFSVLALTTLQRVAVHLPRALLLQQWEAKCIDLVQTLDCRNVHLSRRYVTSTDVQTIKALDRKVLIYTVNELSQANTLFAMGADGIFTDCPGYMISELQN